MGSQMDDQQELKLQELEIHLHETWELLTRYEKSRSVVFKKFHNLQTHIQLIRKRLQEVKEIKNAQHSK